jgi:hypothetical protein
MAKAKAKTEAVVDALAQIELARIYYEDGALFTAVAVLRKVADEIEHDAKGRQRMLDAIIGGKFDTEPPPQ